MVIFVGVIPLTGSIGRGTGFNESRDKRTGYPGVKCVT